LATIKRGGLYSSKRSLAHIDRNKLKDKTSFLNGALLMIKTKYSVGKLEREWSNKKRYYNYSIVLGDISLKNICKIFKI